MEVILRQLIIWRISLRFLHVCGGDPDTDTTAGGFAGFSPRMWRWSQRTLLPLLLVLVFSTYVEVILAGTAEIMTKSRVFSTYVEVIPKADQIKGDTLCFLHVCGGDPANDHPWITSSLFSPRMWRWSWWSNSASWWVQVFSTYVEVILMKDFEILPTTSFLHVCGGDPQN